MTFINNRNLFFSLVLRAGFFPGPKMKISLSNTKTNESITHGFDLSLFQETVQRIKAGNKEIRIEEIQRIFSMKGLIIHHTDKTTQKIIASDCPDFEYPHEYLTSKKLTAVDYNVLFVPRGYFKRSGKRFDVFLSKGHLLLEVELKCINSNNPETISNRIKEGSDQSSRIVLDIHAGIYKRKLIEGLRLGCERNYAVKQIMLFYKSRFHILNRKEILSMYNYNAL